MSDFNSHVSNHLATQMALHRAKSYGDNALHGMILSALRGTWNAAQESICNECAGVVSEVPIGGVNVN